MKIIENQPLQAYNTFGVPGSARYFARINNGEELTGLIRKRAFEYLPKLIIGGGSNILLVNDFGGIVFYMENRGIQIEREDYEHAWVKAGSGTIWHDLVIFSVNKNLSGIENLSLIPGKAGAAPIQNIGAYGVELKDVFESLEAISLETGATRVFTSGECAFGYRDSIFKNEVKGQYAIISLTLRLNKNPAFHIEYNGIREMLKEMKKDGGNLTVKDISNAIIRIRRQKLPDPEKIGNAGSFFKNPELPVSMFRELQNNYPDIPGYIKSDTVIKIPAAWLIEQCGLKGIVRGATGTYRNQPLVLINSGGATGKEIYSLSEEIIDTVKEKFGITLEREVNII